MNNDQVLENDSQVGASARSTEIGCRLMEVPGVGPVLARCAWSPQCRTPQPSSPGRSSGCVDRPCPAAELQRRQGEAGRHPSSRGTAILNDSTGGWGPGRDPLRSGRHGTKRPWLVRLLARRSPKIAAVALANKMARMIWAMMMTGATILKSPAAGPAALNAASTGWRIERTQSRCQCTIGRNREPENPFAPKAPGARAVDRDPS